MPEVALMWANRLLVVGPANELKRFEASNWERKARAKYIEVLECSKTRLEFQFETSKPPLPHFKAVSREWPKLTFLLDYEVEDWALKGLAKAKRGELEGCVVSYAS
jgi:hypothetical protein